jgi:hypothetical protein
MPNAFILDRRTVRLVLIYSMTHNLSTIRSLSRLFLLLAVLVEEVLE